MVDYQLNCRGKILSLGRPPLIMGILNVTPDSFSDGGRFNDPRAAVDRALEMIEQGADIIDIGGESTRPGSQPVPPAEQIRRTAPVIKNVSRQTDAPISIDTTSSEVAYAAFQAGASIINDISALQFDPEMAPLAARENIPVILMHMQGRPRNMQQSPHYQDVFIDVKKFLAARIEYAVANGITRSQIVVDPGIGFGKTLEHNLTLLRELRTFHQLKAPLLIGTSRKSFIGKILDIDDPTRRLFGTAATVAWSVAAGAHIIRVHDVSAMAQVIKLTAAIMG